MAKSKTAQLPQTIYVTRKEFDDKSGQWLEADADPTALADEVGQSVEAGEYRFVRTVRVVNTTEVRPVK